jgi:hypothetical protein
VAGGRHGESWQHYDGFILDVFKRISTVLYSLGWMNAGEMMFDVSPNAEE